MASKNKTGIEKLEEYAYGMKPRRCDDVLELSEQIELEHVSELQALKKRYKTDLQEARDARDIAIKEAAELRDRLMPDGIEWPRFEDGEKITWNNSPDHTAAICLALDGSCYALHYDMPDDERMCIYEVSERVKRPVTEVLGADGLPIKVGETVYEVYDGGSAEVVKSITYVNNFCKINYESDGWGRPNILIHTPPNMQERIEEDAKLDPCEYVRIVVEIITTRLILLAKIMRAWTVTIADLLRRQRELDARTMGGDAA